jgi:hypothetical protein
MRKNDELASVNSCLSKAGPHEMLFVLLSRDPAAPHAIHAWINERIRLGKNVVGDKQIVEAFECARTMESEGKAWGI